MPVAPNDESGYKPLDGGWGWVVVFGAHISIGFAYSMPKALSIFYNDIQEDLECSSSEIALMSSIMLAAMYAGGPVSSCLVLRFGSRPIVIMGGLMCGVSMVTASFGSSIIYLYICVGVIGGCGLAFNLNASLNIISKYFLVRRPLANGLAMAGSPVFLCILAPVNQCLLDNYGWRGSLLVLGAIMLNCCVAGALMRPVAQPPPSPPEQRVEEQPNNSNTNLKESCLKNISFFDVSFFKHRGFIIYLFGSMMFIFGAYAPFLFLSAYAINQGIDEHSAAYLLSFMGFVDMVVRPGTGLAANRLLVDIMGDYKYLFILCGSVIFTGGVFLFLMNIYNDHMLKKEKNAKDREQNQKCMEDQDHKDFKQAPKTVMEQTELEVAEENAAQRDLEIAETPN
ncbi:Monocarboxylate transporter 2 [Nibea albiflora]|uniref:Monocarboxylate transporter 2 n=1 Tax=Nibea albiflora TaxID=240163 RepID=A0ACB7EZT9_NIBAL|nr:Monocarboxylate transporter 2 [Nibea albiflora]